MLGLVTAILVVESVWHEHDRRQHKRDAEHAYQAHADYVRKVDYEIAQMRRLINFLDPTGEYEQAYRDYYDRSFSTGSVLATMTKPPERAPWQERI